MKNQTIRFGIVGVCGGWGRGKMMVSTINLSPGCEVVALCDIDIEGLKAANDELKVPHLFADYDQMLRDVELDAIFIATPMDLHAPQAIAALDKGIHVLSEVPAAVDLQQCKELVAACRRSKAVYMIAENYYYFRENLMVREMVLQGEFGTPYYAEGEYVHGLRWLHEKTRWRRRWQVGVNGITYGTHALGPILSWMPGDRVASVSCVGTGHHYTDADGRPYEMEDSCVMMAKMESGGLIKIRNDLLSNGPGRNYYHLQGTKGLFDSDRKRNQIWLENHCPDQKTWRDIKEFESQFLPQSWREHEAIASKTGHHGGDYMQMLDFTAAIAGQPSPLGIDEAMDMTLPAIISQQSIQNDFAWMNVPDSRKW